VALPSGPPWQRRGESWLVGMHRVIASALIALSIEARTVGPGEGRKLGEVLCFLDQTPGDLLADNRKIVGSAQRKHKSALLQHGAILLAMSDFAPDLPGLRELTGTSADRLDCLQDAVLNAFRSATGWRLQPADWPVAETARRTELIERKYTSPSWNGKR
jgi:hypothetical protein